MGKVGSKIKVGERFGKWITLEYFPKKTIPETEKTSLWKCICDCGTIKLNRTADLIGKHTTMCLKCSCKINTQGNILPNNGGVWNKIFVTLRRSASSRNLDLTLSEEEIKELSLKNCYYCDSPPSNTVKTERGDVLNYNGLDRVNNEKGYTIDNVVSCCSMCNRMKMKIDIQTWIQKMEQIIKNKTKFIIDKLI